MDDCSVSEEESSILPAAARVSSEACGIDTQEVARRSDWLGQCEKYCDDSDGQWPFYDTRRATISATSWSNSPIALQSSAAVLLGSGRRNKKYCAEYHHKSRRSCSLDELHASNSDFGHRKVYAASDPEIYGPGTCDNVWGTPERCVIDTACQEPCKSNGGDACACQRSPDCVLLELSSCRANSDQEISAFVSDAPSTCLVVCADVHASDTDRLVFDNSCARVDGSRDDEKMTCAVTSEDNEREGVTCIGALTSDSCRHCAAESALALPLSPIMRDEAGRIFEGSVCDECNPDGAADGLAGRAIASCPSGVNSCSPRSASSAENDSLTHSKRLLISETELHRDTSLFSVGASEVVARCTNSCSPGSASSSENHTLIHSKGLVISEKTSNGGLASCPATVSNCSTKALASSRCDSTFNSVCSPSSSSIGDVSCLEPATEKEACVSSVTIHGVNVKSGNISNKRPSTLKVTPVYVHQPADHFNVHKPENDSSQTCKMNSPVVKDSEVPHCDDRSCKKHTANTSRYSWPASQSVRLRSRSCSRLRRKHVKSSASFVAPATDWSGSRSIDHRIISLTNTASSGFTVFQTARLGRTLSSARLNDSRKSETFMSLQKEAALKARTHQRCRHKRHSYHATGGPCVSCTNHTNSLGPCFVLGVGQCNLCRDSSWSNDSNKYNDSSLVELECVESKHKTREQKAKAVEPAETGGRNEFMQYTREKCEYSSKGVF